MRLQRLLFARDQFLQDSVILDSAQKKYLFKVLRLQIGDSIIAMDGCGQWWLAELSSEKALLKELMDVDNELPINVSIIAAPTKGTGIETVIQCCTELGMTHFIPLITERTIAKPGANKVVRWQKIAKEATEQSLRQVMPKVHSPIGLKNLTTHLQTLNIQSGFFFSTQGTHRSFSQMIGSLSQEKLSSTAIITGPEGGWTEEEEEFLTACGYQGVSLGKRILRAVTAPICALSILSGIYCED